VSHPHLVPAAVEKQLEQLQTDREAEKEEPSASGTDLGLYRRIAEVKAGEREKGLEEILYALAVQKFMDADVSLSPVLSPNSADKSGRVDTWPCKDGELEQLHTPEAYEMIQNHLALIMGNRLGDATSVAQISKSKVGEVYAASVMYGYFLKRVDQRFQLEKTMKLLPNEQVGSMQQLVTAGSGQDSYQPMPEVKSMSFGHGMKASRLRSYMMSFDRETLQSYATIRSKEAVSLIEKHTDALFGRLEIDSFGDELVKMSFGGLKRLFLEAVTFGSFMWDVESHVDSRYHIAIN
jgi:hypothetical protein